MIGNFVKDPDAAYKKSTPRSSGFAGLAYGAIYEGVARAWLLMRLL